MERERERGQEKKKKKNDFENTRMCSTFKSRRTAWSPSGAKCIMYGATDAGTPACSHTRVVPFRLSCEL